MHDLVRGDVSFSNSELDDLILVRSDGMPTYHFGVVVDDGDMGITHVIRGDDHLTNTPRQINILRALGLPVPAYAHLPMILGPDGARLSKRHGAVNVLEYRDQGYLPEAMLNYLVRLGWAHGDQELFSRDEMVALFDLAAVNGAPSRFNPEKLAWINQQYIQTGDRGRLAARLGEHMQRRGVERSDGPALETVVDAYRERAVTLEDMVQSSWYAFHDFESIDEKLARQHLKPAVGAPLALVRDRLAPAWRMAPRSHSRRGDRSRQRMRHRLWQNWPAVARRCYRRDGFAAHRCDVGTRRSRSCSAENQSRSRANFSCHIVKAGGVPVS